MNKRILNSVLIVSLVVIWSIAGIRFFGSKSIIDVKKESPITLKQSTRALHEKQYFEFKLAERDPFLSSTYIKKRPTDVNPIKAIKKIETKKPWPTIEFYGFVKNENHRNPLALLKVNNTIKRVRQGTKIDGLQVKKVYKDSIVLIKGKEEQSFSRN